MECVYIVLCIQKTDPPGVQGIDWINQNIEQAFWVISDEQSAIEVAKAKQGTVYKAVRHWDYSEAASKQKEAQEFAEYQRLKQKYEGQA